MENDIVIVAPHPDDEIIGCHSFLKDVTCICFGTPMSQAELYRLSDAFMCATIQAKEPKVENLPKAGLYLFPDPYFETHPLHRQWGLVGELMMRQYGYHVLFYTVNMRAPYIFEVPHPEEKRKALDIMYPEKSDLWVYEHKYFLFEGYCEWKIGGYKWED